MSSSASLDNLARSSFPTNLPTATASPISESAPPFPSSAPSSSPRNPNSLSILLSTSDRTLTRLSKILSTPGGQDTFLSTTCYTLTFLQATINRTLESQLESIAQHFAKNASDALLPGETVVATFQAPPLAAALARLSTSSKALARLISDFRIFVRLWGLLGIYTWGKSVYLNPPKDAVLKRIAYMQVLVNFAFQALENAAYLGQHGIITRSAERQGRDWMLSSRFWAAHVALDFVRLWRVRSLWGREVEVEGEEKEDKIRRKEEEEAWWRQLVVNVCYAPMTIHWSVQEGILNETWVGILGSIAGGTRLMQLWKQSA